MPGIDGGEEESPGSGGGCAASKEPAILGGLDQDYSAVERRYAGEIPSGWIHRARRIDQHEIPRTGEGGPQRDLDLQRHWFGRQRQGAGVESGVVRRVRREVPCQFGGVTETLPGAKV